ncbi:DUF5665 domain-containing protein [Roseicyclus persicicus]|uniref:Uncharacterized protein n=1 Tax=Roseicyclus persicicus TaxID=2650661 RepID=A0A7X6GVK6_9RHOB|nr:DUF5665 domain-containing protein [Roseibacterium persicicum]NKX43179.1 hypothetical protein [Roseibacterium persicicum]
MAADPGGRRPDDSGPHGTLEEEVRALRQELTLMRAHKMFLLYQSVPRVLLFRFAAGMAAGLGTVIGATLLLSVIVWSLSQIEFIPIIGEWAVQIAEQIERLTRTGD